MARDNIFVGLEIGTYKICVAVGESRADGTVKILGVGEAPSRGVRKGEIVNFETAGKCIREALVDAEEKSDVMIGSVYLAVTGSHIEGFNNRGAISIPEDREEICEEDFEEVQANAREVSIPQPNMFVHSILQHYYVDGQDGVLNPIGMLGRRLEADFHIIHGVGNRIKNSVRCVKEVGPEVLDVVFAPLATAQVVLDHNQKGLGALVVDIGGGTTDFIVYTDGAVKLCGCVGLGGDHITNDISLGLSIPMNKAERIKCEDGSAMLGICRPGEMILLKDETGFAGREIERDMLHTIIHCRVREMFEMLRRKLDEAGCAVHLLAAGMMLTGGCSMIHGIRDLAEEIFGIPVHVTHAQAVVGNVSAFENPQFSTAIGLIKYAQAMQPEAPRGVLRRLWKKFPFLGFW